MIDSIGYFFEENLSNDKNICRYLRNYWLLLKWYIYFRGFYELGFFGCIINFRRMIVRNLVEDFIFMDRLECDVL